MELEKKTIKELKETCKKEKIKGCSTKGIKKEGIIKLIKDYSNISKKDTCTIKCEKDYDQCISLCEEKEIKEKIKDLPEQLIDIAGDYSNKDWEKWNKKIEKTQIKPLPYHTIPNKYFPENVQKDFDKIYEIIYNKGYDIEGAVIKQENRQSEIEITFTFTSPTEEPYGGNKMRRCRYLSIKGENNTFGNDCRFNSDIITKERLYRNLYNLKDYFEYSQKFTPEYIKKKSHNVTFMKGITQIHFTRPHKERKKIIPKIEDLLNIREIEALERYAKTGLLSTEWHDINELLNKLPIELANEYKDKAWNKRTIKERELKIKSAKEIKEKSKGLIKLKNKFKITSFDTKWESPKEHGNIYGIMDSKHIMLLANNIAFEQSSLNDYTFDTFNKTPVEPKYVILGGDLKFYGYGSKEDSFYLKEPIDKANKLLKKPKTYFKNENPLFIQDNNFTLMIAPRASEFEHNSVFIPYNEYKELNKLSKTQLETKGAIGKNKDDLIQYLFKEKNAEEILKRLEN